MTHLQISHECTFSQGFFMLHYFNSCMTSTILNKVCVTGEERCESDLHHMMMWAVTCYVQYSYMGDPFIGAMIHSMSVDLHA